MKEISDMSNREFNEMARDALDQENKYRKQVLSTVDEIHLYDTNMQLIYTFRFWDKKIKYEIKTADGKKQTLYFTMDKQTKKMIRKMLWDSKKSEIIFFATCTLSLLLLVVAFNANKRQKIDEQVQEYKKSLPNWDDSIRMAKTDADLQRAMDRREQQLLKIEYFRDSLRGKTDR